MNGVPESHCGISAFIIFKYISLSSKPNLPVVVGQWAVLTRNTAREGGYVTITARSHGLLKEGFTLAQACV